MVNLKTRLRRIGNSLGIIVPSEIVSEKNLREGEFMEITIEIEGKTTVGDMIKEAERLNLKPKRPTKDIMDEIDEGED